MSVPKQEDEEIDYLHPSGKPTTIEKPKTQEELSRENQSVQKSIDDADGHHMCSDNCQRHHKV